MDLFLSLGKGSCSFLSWASEISFPLCGFPSMHHLLAWKVVTLHECGNHGTQQEWTGGPQIPRQSWGTLGFLSLLARSASCRSGQSVLFMPSPLRSASLRGQAGRILIIFSALAQGLTQRTQRTLSHVTAGNWSDESVFLRPQSSSRP